VTVTLTYDDVFSRVQIAVTGLSATVDTVRVWRSTNQVNWTYVRGGTDLTPIGNAVYLDDYEFSANVQNYYRVTGFYTGAPTYLATGAASHANNANVSPAVPAGVQEYDTLVIYAAFRARGSGEPNIPVDWNLVADISNVRVMAKIAGPSEVAPNISFTASVANATCSAQMASFRGLAAASMFSPITQDNNPGAQNIAYPAVATTLASQAMQFYLGWKQDDWTSVNTIAGATEIGEPSSTLGDDQGIVWDCVVRPAGALSISAGSFVVTGGASARSVGGVIAMPAAEQIITIENQSITPMITDVWLKNVFRPFLNRAVGCIPNQSDISRRARNGIFDVVNRTMPVAVTDLRSSREWSMEIITQTTDERRDLDLILATGDIFFIQAPPDNPTPTAYVAIQDTSERRPLRRRDCGNDWRVFTLPMIEVAQPSVELSAVLGTWQTVLNTYATWADVLAAHATWASLLTLVGTVDEVVVP